MVETIKRAYSGGINWDWFLEYEVVAPNKIRILKHWRIHHGEEMPEDAYEHEFALREGPGRIVIGATFDCNYTQAPMEVVNPKYVFDYRQEMSKCIQLQLQ